FQNESAFLEAGRGSASRFRRSQLFPGYPEQSREAQMPPPALPLSLSFPWLPSPWPPLPLLSSLLPGGSPGSSARRPPRAAKVDAENAVTARTARSAKASFLIHPPHVVNNSAGRTSAPESIWRASRRGVKGETSASLPGTEKCCEIKSGRCELVSHQTARRAL